MLLFSGVILVHVSLGMELKPSFVVLPPTTTGEFFSFSITFGRPAGLLTALIDLRLPARVHSSLSFPQECSKRANNGRFSLRDLLMVPMQRVLKYPLLLQVRPRARSRQRRRLHSSFLPF